MALLGLVCLLATKLSPRGAAVVVGIGLVATVAVWRVRGRPTPLRPWLLATASCCVLAAAWALGAGAGTDESSRRLLMVVLSAIGAGGAVVAGVGLCPPARHLDDLSRARELAAAAVVCTFAAWVGAAGTLGVSTHLGAVGLVGFFALVGWVGAGLIGGQALRSGRHRFDSATAFTVAGIAQAASAAALAGHVLGARDVVSTFGRLTVVVAATSWAWAGWTSQVAGRPVRDANPSKGWWSSLPLLAVAAPCAVLLLGLRADTLGERVGVFVIAAAGAVLLMSALLWASNRARAGVEHRAMHDPLTGLPNRSLFLDLVKYGFARARRARTRAAVLFIDLDGFKLVNDTSGHAAGDQLLRHVSAQLRSAVREEDTVARLSGDEFAVLLPAVRDSADAMVVADKLLAALAVPCQLGRQAIVPHGSIGVSLFPDHGETPDDVLAAADAAMYAAKQAGRNRAVVAATNNDAASAVHRAAASRLRSALGGGPELSLRLLPIFLDEQPAAVSTRATHSTQSHSRRLVAAEVQAWWRDAEAGWVSPSAFRRVADEAGLRPKLELWLLGQAIRHAPAARAGDVRLVVPIGGRLLCDPAFPALVRELEGGVGLDLVLDGRFSRPGPAATACARAARQLAAFDVDLGLVWNPELEWPLAELVGLPVSRIVVAAPSAGEPATAAVIGAARSRGWIVHARGVGSAFHFADVRAAHCEWVSGSLFARAAEPHAVLPPGAGGVSEAARPTAS